MEQKVIFEEKVSLSPKDMNRVGSESLEQILLSHLRKKLESKCSQHGYVLPKSIQILSRSMGQLENGRFTGNILFHAQAEGSVLYPVNGMRITGEVRRKNKMGLYIIYQDAIKIIVPRDLHLGNDTFEAIEPGEMVTVEIRKSRFQIFDEFILSVGVLVGNGGTVPTATAIMEKKEDEVTSVILPEATASLTAENEEEDLDENEDEEDAQGEDKEVSMRELLA